MFMSVGKDKMITLRLSEQAHKDFKIAADLRGASMSSLLHQFIVKLIREEKEREPQAFKSDEPERAKFVNLSPDSSIPQARKPSKIKKAS
jgi:hypothetical protein